MRKQWGVKGRRLTRATVKQVHSLIPNRPPESRSWSRPVQQVLGGPGEVSRVPWLVQGSFQKPQDLLRHDSDMWSAPRVQLPPLCTTTYTTTTSTTKTTTNTNTTTTSTTTNTITTSTTNTNTTTCCAAGFTCFLEVFFVIIDEGTCDVWIVTQNQTLCSTLDVMFWMCTSVSTLE